MARATVITVESPDVDPETITFSDDEIETINVSTYAFTKYNTEGLGNANDQLVQWLKEAREHERPEVRDWFAKFVTDTISWCVRFSFIIDMERLVLIASSDRDDEVGYTADDTIAAAAFEALSWSYLKAPNDVTDYAIAALRAGVLNLVPNAVSFHVDYTGDEDGSMYVDSITTADGVQSFGYENDTDGEILRAASDLRYIESYARDPESGVTRVNRSDYDIAIFSVPS